MNAVHELCEGSYGCGNPLSLPAPKACRRKDLHVCGKRHGRGIEHCELPLYKCKQQKRDAKIERTDQQPPRQPRVTWTSNEMIRGLDKLYGNLPQWSSPRWATFVEFRCGVGFQVDTENAGTPAAVVTHDPIRWESRLDYLAINLWPSKGQHFIAHEVKVSRGDFLTEIKNPTKRDAALAISTEYYFVTPVALVRPEEIPSECGLMEVRYGPRGGLYIDTIIPALERELQPIHWRTFAAMAARSQVGAA